MASPSLRDPATASADAETTGRVRRRAEPLIVQAEDAALLLKAVNTLAIIPKSARITTLGRKSYN
ncbi:MAG TPA: hypothetical protein PKW63_09165, partial [Vicinamibacterales bacterium]|nr:hypothetical protein [Vicinamibacterales bacterium]